jgi:hypothetical protein
MSAAGIYQQSREENVSLARHQIFYHCSDSRLSVDAEDPRPTDRHQNWTKNTARIKYGLRFTVVNTVTLLKSWFRLK